MARPYAKKQQNALPLLRKERSLKIATAWSILVVIGMAIAITLIACAIPGTALFNYWRLLMVNGQVSPGSELLRQLLDQINREDTLFVTPVSLFCGGIALGRLAPRALRRRRVLLSATGVSGGIILACLVFFWGFVLHDQHWRLHSDEMDTQKATMQTIASIVWIIAYILGTLGGLFWRDAGRNRRPMEPPSPTLTSASR